MSGKASTTPEVAPETGKKPMYRGGRKPGSKGLTIAQKAEAVALWRAGEVTLDDLARKFKKRPETFSRLFKKVGAKKGETSAEIAKKASEKIEARVASSVEETLVRIAAMKDEHQKMASGIAKLAWAEIVRARQAGLDLAGLKDVMQTLKLAGEVIANSRKELYTLHGVEEAEKKGELEDLPELTVRELTQGEVDTLRDQEDDDMLDSDPGLETLGEEGL
jgi:phosphoribosyl-ATP pyrophosphohydrolase